MSHWGQVQMGHVPKRTVSLGTRRDEIKMKEIEEKVNYCLNCKIKPCSLKGCPLENPIPDFIKELKEGDIEKAYKIRNDKDYIELLDKEARENDWKEKTELIINLIKKDENNA